MSTKIKKYFEIEIHKPQEWDLNDYLFFLLDSFLNNILPFFIGFLVAETKNLLLLMFIIIPIYININFMKKQGKSTKKIFLK